MPIEPWLRRAAALRPDSLAVTVGGDSLAYGELAQRAGRVASGLLAAGVESGERVAVPATADMRFVLALHGCLLAGAVVVPLDPRLTASERAERMGGARRVLDALPDDDPRPEPAAWPDDAPALVVHTSGTTGRPKPVVLTHGNVLANALGSAVALGLARDESWLSPLPLAHVGGLMVLARSAVYATHARLMPPPFDAQRVAAALSSEASIASLVPTMLRRVLDAGLAAPPRLRAILLGGAPAGRPLLERARAAAVPVAQTYGLTEACSQVTVSEPGDVATAGRALPGVSVSVAPDGEIVVQGPTVAGGGTLRTGDLGSLDAAGRLVVTGRRDDLIVSGGENVMPAEVEEVLLGHPLVADAAVLGRPDPEWGSAVVARIVTTPGARLDGAELHAFCARRLARFKVPKAFEPAEHLPRTPSGKLRRDLLGDEPPGS